MIFFYLVDGVYGMLWWLLWWTLIYQSYTISRLYIFTRKKTEFIQKYYLCLLFWVNNLWTLVCARAVTLLARNAGVPHRAYFNKKKNCIYSMELHFYTRNYSVALLLPTQKWGRRLKLIFFNINVFSFVIYVLGTCCVCVRINI